MPSTTTTTTTTRRSGYWVTLPNGREVNVLSEVGANELLTYHHETRVSNTQNYLQHLIHDYAIYSRAILNNNSSNSSPLLTISSTNAKNGNAGGRGRGGSNEKNRQPVGLTPPERCLLVKMCYGVYIVFTGTASKCTPEIYDRCMSDVDLERYLKHCVAVLTDLTNRSTWTQTGVLEKCDEYLFASLMQLACHVRFAKMVVQDGQEPSNLARVVANFIAAVRQESNPNLLPCPVVTKYFLLFTIHTYARLVEEGGWSCEKALEKLESAGLLAQFLRCSTQPNDAQSLCLDILEKLLLCPVLVQTKFCAGQATGDLLNRLLISQEGYKGPHHPGLMGRLGALQTLADWSSSPGGAITYSIPCYSCRHCGKFSEDTELFTCSRCKTAFYCSKDCQRADWKIHKAHCKLANERRGSEIQSALLAIPYASQNN